MDNLFLLCLLTEGQAPSSSSLRFITLEKIKHTKSFFFYSFLVFHKTQNCPKSFQMFLYSIWATTCSIDGRDIFVSCMLNSNLNFILNYTNSYDWACLAITSSTRFAKITLSSSWPGSFFAIPCSFKISSDTVKFYNIICWNSFLINPYSCSVFLL